MGHRWTARSVSSLFSFWALATIFSLFSCSSGGSSGPDSGPVNRAPSAFGGYDRDVVAGTVVILDGSLSSDPDGDVLTYSWSFLSRPGGSTAEFSSSLAVYPTFIADKAGVYQIQLVVNDGLVNSTADTVTVIAAPSAGNSAPIAYAGADLSVKTGSTVTLDGSGSMDVDGDSVSYFWSFTSRPAGSSAVLSNLTSTTPSFTADKDGSYVLQLVVNDGQVNSTPDSMTIAAATPVLVHVPDTGQNMDYTAVFGEDSDYTIHPPSFTPGGNGTVIDTVTGLVWQQQDDGTLRDWSTAMSYCETLTLAGYTDWRLPDNRELVGIVNYGRSNPAIDATAFPNTQPSYYWTSTEYGLDPASAWDVIFDIGVNDTSRNEKIKTHYVRCVRGVRSQPVLTDNGDGTITDEMTALIWQKIDDNMGRKWVDALAYCEGLNFASQTDWRLPSIKELMSIVDYRFWPVTIDTAYFPSVRTTAGLPTYWSSTTVSSSTNQGFAVKFAAGLVSNPGKSGQWYVRCVRGGQ